MDETLSAIAYYAIYQLQEVLDEIPDSKDKKRISSFCDNIITLISADYPEQFQNDTNLYKYSNCIKKTIEGCVSKSKWASKMEHESQKYLECIALMNLIVSCAGGVGKRPELYFVKFRQRFNEARGLFESMESSILPHVGIDTKTIGVFILYFIKELNKRFQKMENHEK